MKITYIHQHFKKPSEGGGGRPYEFARRLVAEGHQVTMIRGFFESSDEELEGIRLISVKSPYQNAMTSSRRIQSFMQFMIKSSYLAASIEADVIFASSTPLTVAVPGLVGKLFRRVPLVFEVRDLWPSVPIQLGYLKNPLLVTAAKILEKATYKNSAHVIALSPGMKDGILEVSPNTKVTVIPNASDFELFFKSADERLAFRESQGWDDTDKVVVYAGGFGPTYQLEWAVELAAKVAKENIKFVLLGEGKDSPKLKLLAEELGLDSTEILPGKLPRSEVPNFVASGDLVLSSLREDQCLQVNSLNKVFDGLAAGQPIVLNHDGWLKDVVVESHSGWKLSRDTDVAAEELIEILRSPQKLSAARKNSEKLGREQFDRELLYASFSKILQSNSKDA